MASSKKIGKSYASKSQGMLLWLGIALLVLVLDQFTKVLVLGAFQLGDSTPITSFFNLVRVHNHGAAFSFLAGAGGWQRWFFTGIGVAAAIFMVWMLHAHPGQKLFSLAISLILGGAIGNVIDRLPNARHDLVLLRLRNGEELLLSPQYNQDLVDSLSRRLGERN